MPDLSRKTASVYINHQPAEDALIALQKLADILSTKIKAGGDAGKNMVSEIAKLDKVKDSIANVQKQIDAGLRPSFNQVSTQVSKLRADLKKMSEDAPGYADKFKAYQKASLELQRLGDQVNKVNAEQSKLGEFFNGFGGAFALGGIAAAGAALVGFFSDAVGEAAQAEEASARLQATLENLGKADAFDRITAQSDELAKSLGYLDNDDINGVFEKLLTYGKLTEAQMSKLAPIILDFSAKTRTSLPEATDTILKALEGNGKALKTFGINIKDAGTEEERFGIVTGELAGKVAGAAQAFKGTFAGSVATTKQTVADLKEEIGNGLLPAFKFLLEVLDGAIKGMEIFGSRVASVFDQIVHLRSGSDQLKKEAAEAEADSISNFSNSQAKDFIQKPLEDQKRLLKSYVANYEDATHKYLDALKVGSGATKEQQESLRVNYLQFRSDVGTLTAALKNSIAEDDKRLQEKAQAEADEKADAAKKKAEADQKTAEAKFKQLQNDFKNLSKKISEETDKLSLTSTGLAIKQVNDQADEQLKKLKEEYQAKVISQQQYSAVSLQIESIRAKGLQKIADDINKSLAESNDKVELSEAEISIKNIDKLAADELTKQKELLAAKITNLEQYTNAALDIERNRVKAILDLNKIETIPVTATRATGATIGSAGGPSAGARASAQDNGPSQTARIFNVEQITADATQVLSVAQGVFDIVNAFNAAADARDQARIDKRVKQGETEKASAKRLLDGKLIDQQEYDRRTRAADEKTRKETAKLKKAQFDRDKKAQIVSATIMGAQAILSALTLQPFYLGLIMAGIAAVKTVAEINKIKQTKAPEFGRGGLLDGPAHSQGGMPVVDPRTGRKVMEVEGGEPILSKRTYRNNRPIIDRLLQSSLYQNGAAIEPAWRNTPYFGMNYGALNRSVNQVRRYERGGILGTDGGSNDAGFNSDALLQTLGNLNATMQKPAKNYVLITDINAANDTLDDIKNDTVMSRKS